MSKNTIVKRDQPTVNPLLYYNYPWWDSNVAYAYCINSISTVGGGKEQISNKIVSPEDGETRFHPMFSGWENVANIQFIYDTNVPELCIARGDFITDVTRRGQVFYDFQVNSDSTVRLKSSQIYLNSADATAPYNPGDITYWPGLHEIGHSLGLKHSFEAFEQNPSLPPSEDHTDFTLMSYTNGRYAVGGTEYYPATPMIYDIAAAQSLYGTNTAYMSGNTRYYVDGQGSLQVDDSARGLFSLRGKVMTLWDAGGVDTVDLSAVSTDVTVDLREGVDPASDPQNTGKFSPYVTAFNDNRLFMAYGVEIENVVTGAGNDVVHLGQKAGNANTGNGDDIVFGSPGNDSLQGGNGFDSYRFEAGHGHDSITDTDSRGEIWYNAVPVTGIAQEDTNNPGVRWTLERNDGVSFIITRTGYGVQTSMGSDLKITIGGSLATSTQSITLRHFPFAEQQGLGIVLDKVSNINATDASNALRASLSSLTPQAISWGDPHLVTSDGLKYDFQQRGEYVLLDSPGDGYQLQVRQEKWDRNPKVSVNTALATELNGTKVMIKPVGNVATQISHYIQENDISVRYA